MERELILRATYEAFNAREIEAVLELVDGDGEGNLLAESEVVHVYTFRDGLIAGMDVEDGK